MRAFDLDLAYSPPDVVSGLERLFRRLGCPRQPVGDTAGRCRFVLAVEGCRVDVTVEPLPVERQTYVGFFPRTLVSAESADADLTNLRRHIALAFFRASG